MLRILTSQASLIASVGVYNTGHGPKSEENQKALKNFVCRPTDLPIYSTLHPQKEISSGHAKKASIVRETIEGGVGFIRRECKLGLELVVQQKRHFDGVIDTAIAHSQSTIDYLNEPTNQMARFGAISVGGLVGFLCGFRRGFIKKIVYMTTTGGIMASICYPHQAEYYAREALFGARKAFAISYNFVKGAKPGDEVVGDTISKFPTSVQDLKHLLWDLYDDAKSSVFPRKD